MAKIESKVSAYLSPEPTTPATRGRRGTPKPSAARVSKPLEGKAPKPKGRTSRIEVRAALSWPEARSETPGALKDSILAALQKAGDEGVAVRGSRSGARSEKPEHSCVVQQHWKKGQRRYEGWSGSVEVPTETERRRCRSARPLALIGFRPRRRQTKRGRRSLPGGPGSEFAGCDHASM